MSRNLSIGQYVQVADGQFGTIAFIGTTSFSTGEWVGVALENPTGKNDGTVQGVHYFDCKGEKYGSFVRPAAVKVVEGEEMNDGEGEEVQRSSPVRKAPTPQPAAAGGGLKTPLKRPSIGGIVTPGRRISTNTVLSPTPRIASTSAGVARLMMTSPTKQSGRLSVGGSSGTTTPRTNTPVGRTTSSSNVTSRPSSRTTTMGPPPVPTNVSSNRRSSLATPTTPIRSASFSSTSSSKAGMRPALKTVASAVTRRTSTTGSISSGRSSPDVTPKETPSTLKRSRLSNGADDVKGAVGIDPMRKASGTILPVMTEATSPGDTGAKSSSATTREIEDLKSKIRMLEKRRIEDREKLQSMTRVEQERDKFELIIQKLQTKMQPQQAELAELRRQIKEIEAEREELENQKTENDMIVEMAALDREMAEENYEVLKTEVVAMKDKIEELEMEVEVLREENSELGKEMSPQEKTSAGWLQMERQNERLREALLKLRDVTMQQEAELRDTLKSLEEENSELQKFKEQYEITREKLSQNEVAIEDLRSQLDHALGAEEMLEELTEKNLSYSEEVEELKATIEDLEALQELADELEINHVETGKQMQEELDYKDLLIGEQTKRLLQQEETALDFEYTIARFRELVATLQADLDTLRATQQVSETATEELSSRSRAMMDLNLKLQMSASKAQVKTIDLELRKMEVIEATEHLQIVQMYLPESFSSERDSILALLRFKRVSFKAHILQTHIREKLSSDIQNVQEESVISACDVCDKLTWINAMCGRFVNCMSSCSTSHFERFRGALTDLEPVERALNTWIDAIRRDELKEKQVADELSRTLALMSHLGEVHLTNNLESYAESVQMKVTVMQSYLENTASAITFARNLVAKRMSPTTEEGDMTVYFVRKADSIIANCRSAKVIVSKVSRSLEELKSRSLTLRMDTFGSFENCESLSKKLADYARQTGFDLCKLVTDEQRTDAFTYDEIQSTMYRTTEKLLSLVDSDLFQSAGKELKILTNALLELGSTASDLDMTVEFEKGSPPWITRAQEIRTKKTVHVDTEDEIRRLKDEAHAKATQIKLRDQALEESTVRIEHLQARMITLTAQTEKLTQLELDLTESTIREKEYTESLDNLTEELQSLEAEAAKWKKLANDKRVLGETDKAGTERAIATAREVDTYKKEIESLQGAVRFLRDDARRARNADIAVSDSWLFEPLNKIDPDEIHALDLAAEGRDMLAELMHLSTTATVFDLGASEMNPRQGRHRLTRDTPQYHYMRQREDYEALVSWRDSIVARSVVYENKQRRQQQHQKKSSSTKGLTTFSRMAKVNFSLPLVYTSQLKKLELEGYDEEGGGGEGGAVDFEVERVEDYEYLVGNDGVLVKP